MLVPANDAADWTVGVRGQLGRAVSAAAFTLALLNVRFLAEAGFEEIGGATPRVLLAELLLAYVVVFWVRLSAIELMGRYRAWAATGRATGETGLSYQARTTE